MDRIARVCPGHHDDGVSLHEKRQRRDQFFRVSRAEAPEAGMGSKSAQFTVNAMYVTGQITGASVHGDTATLTGAANITGLGAGSNVSFTFVVQKGGPGATSVLTVGTLPGLAFHEILLQGSFDVAGE